MDLFGFFLKVFVGLFAVISPISAVPIFLSMTPHNTRHERAHMAKIACIVSTVVLLLFAVAGELIFKLMGITLPAFQIAGGLLLFGIGYSMMHAHESESRISEEERLAGIELDNVAISPLAIPLLAGPGAISTVILLQGEATHWAQSAIIYITLPVLMILSYYLFKFTSDEAGWIKPIVLKVVRRLTGLILAAMAVQFVINGVTSLHLLA